MCNRKLIEHFISDENVHVKILVPSNAAGAIIGKGGEAIAQIQKESGAKVKMSKANDFYPGKVIYFVTRRKFLCINAFLSGAGVVMVVGQFLLEIIY